MCEICANYVHPNFLFLCEEICGNYILYNLRNRALEA